jgi:hypothetical protein
MLNANLPGGGFGAVPHTCAPMETDTQHSGPDQIAGSLSDRDKDASPEALRARIRELEAQLAGAAKTATTIESVHELFDLPETVVYSDDAGHIWEVVDGMLQRTRDAEEHEASAMAFPVTEIYNPLG